METGKPSASDWRMTQSPPHERERKRILQIIDRHFAEHANFPMFTGDVCVTLEAIIREILEGVKMEPWDEMWEPNYWDTPPEPISASLVEETEKQG